MGLHSTDRESWRKIAGLGAGALLLAAWAWLALAPGASACICVANFNGDQTISRANLDGSDVNTGSSKTPAIPAASRSTPPTYYWANLNGDRGGPPVPGGGIGRANLGGCGRT